MRRIVRDHDRGSTQRRGGRRDGAHPDARLRAPRRSSERRARRSRAPRVPARRIRRRRPRRSPSLLGGWTADSSSRSVSTRRRGASRRCRRRPRGFCAATRARSRAAGGFDLAILGLGPERAPRIQRASIRSRPRRTGGRALGGRAWRRTPRTGAADQVPRRAITAGMDLLLAASRGLARRPVSPKRDDPGRALLDDLPTPSVPASFLQEHRDVVVLADRDARDPEASPTPRPIVAPTTALPAPSSRRSSWRPPPTGGRSARAGTSAARTTATVENCAVTTATTATGPDVKRRGEGHEPDRLRAPPSHRPALAARRAAERRPRRDGRPPTARRCPVSR